MKVQLVSPIYPAPESPSYGVFVQRIVEGLRRRGVEVELAAVVRGKRASAAAKTRAHLRLGIEVAMSAMSSADCMYVHSPTWFSIGTLLAARARHKKLILHLHGSELYPNSVFERAGRTWLGWVARSADVVVVPSEYFGRAASRGLGVLADRIVVSPSGGVSLETFQPMDKVQARQQFSLVDTGPVVGFVGRLVEGKGWDVYLRCIAELHRRGRPVVALMVGDGPDRAKVTELASELGVTSLVRLPLLEQSRLRIAYAAMDVLVFPTRRPGESLGLVPLEAMAVGCPVVGSNAYAVPEYISPAVNGFLAEPQDVEGFADRIETVLDLETEERAAMSSAAQDTAARFDSERVMDAFVGQLEARVGLGPGR